MSDIKRPEISVILPTYNERENIIDLMSEIAIYIDNHVGKPFEFVVVDDDSPDKTWEVVTEKSKSDSRVRVFRRTKEKGLASAIRRGIQESQGKIVCWLDCDFSMPAHKLAYLINKVYSGYDICVGSRFIKGGKDVRGPVDSWTAVVLSWLMNHFIFVVLGHSFKDYTSGFIAVKKEVFNTIKINGDYGEYFIDLIFNAIKKGYKILEVPYYCLPRRAGVSKTGVSLLDYLRAGWKYITITLKLRLTR